LERHIGRIPGLTWSVERETASEFQAMQWGFLERLILA